MQCIDPILIPYHIGAALEKGGKTTLDKFQCGRFFCEKGRVTFVTLSEMSLSCNTKKSAKPKIVVFGKKKSLSPARL